MPMTTTHALVPLAGALAFATRPMNWKLILAAAVAAALPDIDTVIDRLGGLSYTSALSHRGATHSIVVAIVAGLIASTFAKAFLARPMTVAVVIAAAMASHAILDMMSDSPVPVACLWPISSARLFADWRPIHSIPVHHANFLTAVIARTRADAIQVILPMFALAAAFRAGRTIVGKR